MTPISGPQNPFLNRLLAAYGEPRKEVDDSRKFLAEYTRLLGGYFGAAGERVPYTHAEMSEAADRLLLRRKFKTWPTIAECVEVLREAREAIKSKTIGEARKLQQRQQTAAKQLTPVEQREAERFVDECAAGNVDMGYCHAALQKLAISMRARRVRLRLRVLDGGCP